MTEIIPAINSESFSDVVEKIQRVEGLTRWIHIDVADGTFTQNTLWHNPQELASWTEENSNHQSRPLIEVHLMIENPEDQIEKWIVAGAKRIIVHVETIKNTKTVEKIKSLCDVAGVFLMLAIAPHTPASAFDSYIGQNIVCFQILAVRPGLPGQLFEESPYDKIRYIRKKCPYCDIEVDGGVNKKTIKKCHDAGANLFVAASAIFNAPDIKKVLADLQENIRPTD